MQYAKCVHHVFKSNSLKDEQMGLHENKMNLKEVVFGWRVKKLTLFN